ncbi:DegT/DnrJ/EryC1/StrS family aminotransferase [Hymenobacter antarcticus]
MPDTMFHPTRPLPYGGQNITEADVAAVTASLHADYLTQGPTVAEFEKQFAAYVGARCSAASDACAAAWAAQSAVILSYSAL